VSFINVILCKFVCCYEPATALALLISDWLH